MNIEIHGLPDEYFELIGEAIWRQLVTNLPSSEVGKCAVTKVLSRSFNHKGRNTPFLRVYSSKKSDFEVARKLLKPVQLPGTLRKKVIECVLLAECFEE